jgi:hypothetical protein
MAAVGALRVARNTCAFTAPTSMYDSLSSKSHRWGSVWEPAKTNRPPVAGVTSSSGAHAFSSRCWGVQALQYPGVPARRAPLPKVVANMGRAHTPQHRLHGSLRRETVPGVPGTAHHFGTWSARRGHMQTHTVYWRRPPTHPRCTALHCTALQWALQSQAPAQGVGHRHAHSRGTTISADRSVFRQGHALRPPTRRKQRRRALQVVVPSSVLGGELAWALTGRFSCTHAQTARRTAPHTHHAGGDM